MTRRLRVSGIEDFNKVLKQAGKPFINQLGQDMVETMEKHLKRTYARKVDTGALRKSIRSRWIKTKSDGFIQLGNTTTVRKTGKRSPINYAKFIEFGFKGHMFPTKDMNPGTNKLKGIKKKYAKVSGYKGLHGLAKAEEKTRKELNSLVKRAFKKVTAR